MNPALPAPTVTVGSAPAATADPFAGAARRVSVRERLRVPHQAMAAASAVLLPLGLVMVLLSWWGAARTPYLFEQVPYLISGGLLGLGLVVTGGFVLFGSWISRTSSQQQAITLELLEAVREVRDEIAALQSAPAAASTKRTTSRGSNGSSGSGLVATQHGSMLHRPDCVVVAHRDDVHAVSTKEAGGLSACQLCDPLALSVR
jgi:hypothetical protein